MLGCDINRKRVALHCCTREVIWVVCEFPYVVYKQEVCLSRSALPYRSRRSAERCFTHYCATADVKRRRLFCRRSTFYDEFGHPSLPRHRSIAAGASEDNSCKAGMYQDSSGLTRLWILEKKGLRIAGKCCLSSERAKGCVENCVYVYIIRSRTLPCLLRIGGCPLPISYSRSINRNIPEIRDSAWRARTQQQCTEVDHCGRQINC
jgi:hypothetical protein